MSSESAVPTEKGSRRKPKRRPDRTVYGIEPCPDGSFRICAVRLQKDRILDVDSRALDSENAREVSEEIGYRANRQTVLALPRHEIIVRTIRLPTTDPAEISRMIPYEAETIAPWPAEDVCVSYESLGEDAEGYAQVLLFLVRREWLDDVLKRLREFGLRPSRVEVSTLSIARLASTIEGQSNAAFLSSRATGIEYVRFLEGKPVFSRGKAPDSPLDAMVRESVAIDERRFGKDDRPTQLVLARGTENGREICDLQEQIPFPLASFADLPVGTCDVEVELSNQEIVCVGAALAPEDVGSTSDLLPESEARRVALRKIAKQIPTLVLSIALLFFLLFGLGSHYFGIMKARGDAARSEIAKLEKDVGNIEAKAGLLDFLEGERAKSELPLDIVLELYDKTPAPIAVNQMHFDGRGKLVLTGEAPEYTTVFEYVANLNKSDVLFNVDLIYAISSKSSEASLLDFKLKCDFKERGKTKTKGPGGKP